MAHRVGVGRAARSPSRRGVAARRRGRVRRRSGRTTSAAGAPGRASRRRSARARGGAAGRSGCSARSPGSASPSSLNRRGPSSRASTTSRLQRSPTRSSAASRDVGSRWAGARSWASAMVAMVGARSGLVTAPVSSRLQVASLSTTRTHTEQPPMSAIEELQTAVRPVAERVGPSDRRRSVAARAARASSSPTGKVLTNAHNLRGDEVTVTFADGRRDARHRRRRRRRRRPGRHRRRHRRRHAARVGRRLGAHRRHGRLRRRRQPRRRDAASRSGSSRPSLARSAGPVAGGSRAASSTPRRSRPARPAGRSLDADGRLVGINTNRIGEGFYLALPADAALRGRVDALGRGESPERLRLGVAVAPSHVARRMRRSVGLPERDGRARPRCRGRQPRGGGRDRGRRPDRRGRRHAP